MPHTAPLRAVVFDLDGLMFNTEELYQQCGSELLARRGRSFEGDLIDRMMGRPGRVALEIMIEWHGLADSVDDLADESARIMARLLSERLAPMPGLVDLLAALEGAEIPKAVATSSGRPFTDAVLGRFDFGPRFEFVLTQEDVEQGKPHPEVYLLAARRLGLGPEELMVLEDSQNGCRSAVASGAFTVAVPGGQSRRHDFSGSQLVADSLADPRIYAALQVERPPATD